MIKHTKTLFFVNVDDFERKPYKNIVIFDKFDDFKPRSLTKTLLLLLVLMIRNPKRYINIIISVILIVSGPKTI